MRWRCCLLAVVGLMWVGKLVSVCQLSLTQLLLMVVSTGFGINRWIYLLVCCYYRCYYCYNYGERLQWTVGNGESQFKMILYNNHKGSLWVSECFFSGTSSPGSSWIKGYYAGYFCTNVGTFSFFVWPNSVHLLNIISTNSKWQIVTVWASVKSDPFQNFITFCIFEMDGVKHILTLDDKC